MYGLNFKKIAFIYAVLQIFVKADTFLSEAVKHTRYGLAKNISKFVLGKNLVKAENELKNITTVIFNTPLKDITYTKTGGPADIVAFPKTKEEVINIIKYCEKKYIPWMVIGKGSNLLVKEGGIRGMVIILKKMRNISIKGQKLIAEAGVKLNDASLKALQHSLTGLEFLCGIPGSIGGAVYMNAGSYGVEIKDLLLSADLLFPDGTIKTFSNEEMHFSYRYSAVQQMNCVIIQATFGLNETNKESIKEKIDELTELRTRKQPLEYPSCGSVFKRPKGFYAGKLIKDAGLQGLKCGGAQISNKHAGFIVNIDNATATDYIDLIKYTQRTVEVRFKVMLNTEVCIVGES